MSTVLVTGASGFVGSHVVPALLDAGHRVAVLVRSEAAGRRILDRLPAASRDAVELRRGDVTQPATLGPALAGIDAVVHLVAVPRDWDNGATLRLVNTEGTRNVVAAMSAAGVRRLVHLGALGVADDPALHYAQSKAKAEAIVEASALEWTILKPSLMYGPRDGFFNILASLVRMSPLVVPMPGSGAARFQPLAVTDLGRMVVASLTDPSDGTIHRSLPVGGPRFWTYREILEEVLRGMGSRRAIVPMPLPLIRAVAATAERFRLPFPVATDQLRQLKLDNTGPLTSVHDAFGFEPLDMGGRLTHLRRKVRDQEPGPH
ncbi:MAG: complex I NDUFA9 subunit family protein [Candidatus Limnocylindrales bacterium]